MCIRDSSYLILTGLLNPFGVSVAAAAGIGLKVSTFAGMQMCIRDRASGAHL